MSDVARYPEPEETASPARVVQLAASGRKAGRGAPHAHPETPKSRGWSRLKGESPVLGAARGHLGRDEAEQ